MSHRFGAFQTRFLFEIRNRDVSSGANFRQLCSLFFGPSATRCVMDIWQSCKSRGAASGSKANVWNGPDMSSRPLRPNHSVQMTSCPPGMRSRFSGAKSFPASVVASSLGPIRDCGCKHRVLRACQMTKKGVGKSAGHAGSRPVHRTSWACSSQQRHRSCHEGCHQSPGGFSMAETDAALCPVVEISP